jgi:hypothetical protein
MSFNKLSRKPQLNCICNHTAKQRIAMDGMEGAIPGRMVPLKPIDLFVRGKKITSETGGRIRFWAQHQLARMFYNDRKILCHEQFDSVDWMSIHRTLHNLPRLFQVWAGKQVLSIAGTMSFLSHQEEQGPLCSSCLNCKETCKHVAKCQEVGRAQAFAWSASEVELWLTKNNAHPDLRSLLLCYLWGRGALSCYECATALNLPHIFQEFDESQDVIGWDNFVMGMVSSKLLPIQSDFFLPSKSSSCATRWISGLITQLLQVTHTQWIYQCILVHDHTTGMLISAHKEELLKEIDRQLTLGLEGLAEEDRFLLECNFDSLTATTGEHQEYWLLAIEAAREVSCICTKSLAAQQQHCSTDTKQRRA